MIVPPIPHNETARLQALNQLNLLGSSEPDPALDRLTRLAAKVIGVESALISLVAADFQHFKSCYGFTGLQTARDISFCGHTILGDELMLIPDARLDPRFSDNPVVTGPPYIRFYAGKALKTLSGFRIGSLCIFDPQPRDLDEEGVRMLLDVTTLVQKELYAREFALRASVSQARADQEITRQESLFRSTFDQAAVGVAHRSLDGNWLRLNEHFASLLGYTAESLLQVPLTQLLGEDGTQRLRAVRQRLLDGGNNERCEEQLIHRDGYLVWLELTFSVFRGDNGQPWFFVLIAQDISIRKQTEAELNALQEGLKKEIAQQTQQLSAANASLASTLDELKATQNQTLQTKRRLSETLATALEAFVGVTQDGTIVDWNQQATETFGWTREEAMGNNFADLIILTENREQTRQAVYAFVEHAAQPALFERGEMMARHKNGHPIPVEKTVSPIFVNDRYLFNIFLHDISDRRQAEDLLRDSREQLQTITDNLPVLIGYIESDLRCRYLNATYQEWFDRDPHLLMHRPIPEVITPHEWAQLESHVSEAMQGRKHSWDMVVDRGGRRREVRMTLIPDRANDGQIRGVYLLGVDLTDRKRLEETLRREALEDALTGLPNRRALLQLINTALGRQQRQAKPFAVFFLDLDGFKAVNDRFGHDAGDEVLKTFGKRLRASVRKIDAVARLAGDEFTILLEDLQDARHDAARVAEKIVQSMQEPFLLENGQVTLSTSIGIAIHMPGDALDAEALLNAADTAMYEVKQATKNGYRFAEPKPAQSDPD